MKLNEAPKKEIGVDFFKVGGATLKTISKGSVAEEYILNIDSLAGKEGSIVVNGQTKSYSFKVVVVPASVSSITAMTPTTITVKLKEIPTKPLTTASFDVTGATLKGEIIKQKDDIYVLNIESLQGKGQGTVTVNGVSCAYNFPEGRAKAVSAEFDNYRQIKVTFDRVVDEATAMDPKNYYLEIVEGDTRNVMANGDGILDKSLSLAELDKHLSDSDVASSFSVDVNGDGVADNWFTDGKNPNIIAQHIFTKIVDGKTVVFIQLPEDARFTNSLDEFTKKTKQNDDDEQTLQVIMANDKKKPFVKNTTVYLGIRNVESVAGVKEIDTKVFPILIEDKIAPEIMRVTKKFGNPAQTVVIEDIEKETTKIQVSDYTKDMEFEFNEPVFDAHGTESDIMVYVNGEKIKSTREGNLGDVLKFAMSKDSTYEDSKKAVLDLKAAISATKEGVANWTAGKIVNIKIVGITDLAGNIQVPSAIDFNIELVDPEIGETNEVKPTIQAIEQVADNVFRIEWNRTNATGKFVIENADGENGILEQYIPLSTEYIQLDGTKKYYSYVDVKAEDNQNVLDKKVSAENNVLSYDGQDYIIRTVKVTNVAAISEMSGDLLKSAVISKIGNPFTKESMKIAKDIYAPELEGVIEKLSYAKRGTDIKVKVVDKIPSTWVRDYNIQRNKEVRSMIYDYNAAETKFGLTLNKEQTKAQQTNEVANYLPVEVSYEKDSKVNKSVLTNVDAILQGSTVNKGVEGSLKFTNLDHNGLLSIELFDYYYANLLDDHISNQGKLVGGETYEVNIPKAYFSDEALDAVYTTGGDETIYLASNKVPSSLSVDMAKPSNSIVGFDEASIDKKYDVLYVSSSRTEENGYTSNAITAKITIPEKEITTIDGVPQTSKELIFFNETTNELELEFTGAIDPVTLKDPKNYKLNGKLLSDYGMTSEDIKYVVDNNATLTDETDDKRYAKFKVPTNSIKADGDVAIEIMNVANPAGGKMTPVATKIFLLDNTEPSIIDIREQGQRQIKLTFDEPVQYKAGAEEISAAKNFKVICDGKELTVLKASVSDSNVVTLDLGTDIPASGLITIETKIDQNDGILIQDKSTNKNPMKKYTYSLQR